MSVIRNIQKLLKNKDVSVASFIQGVIQGLESHNADNAFVGIFAETATKVAATLDAQLANGGDLPAGFGIPVGIKDNMCLENEHVTCASKILSGYRSPYTATAVQNLLNHGFVPVGRTNMDEFAMGSSNEYSVYGPVNNPWDSSRVSGGSSGGAAAAVAAGLVPVTLGSDTGGSIRQPASFCGVVGLKPTYGRVSRYGLVAFASSLDQIGPLGQTVEDVAITMDALAGFDPNDSTSEKRDDHGFSSNLESSSLKGKRVGVPNQLMASQMNDEVKSAVQATLSKMEAMGAHIEPFDFPYFDEAIATYYILAPAEASSNLSRFDGVRYGHRADDTASLKEMIETSRQQGFGDEVKRRIILGTYVLSSGYYDAYYGKAQQVRAVISKAYANVFERFDFICSPTAPTTAFQQGQHAGDPLTMYLSDIATIPVNLAGLPALSLPCGMDSDGLPIGFQITAPWFKEHELLKASYALEAALEFKQKKSFDMEVLTHGV
ncbi:MAG: Asp-tRNA(Asn)/Glu-tRNA(Gln) amidotransferase subunit GatA [Candidatus Marinamargulisbacteria bacterium]